MALTALMASWSSVVAAAETKVGKPAPAPAPKTIAVLGEGKGAGDVVERARKVVPEGWDAHGTLKLVGSSAALWKALEAPKLRKAALDGVRAALTSQKIDAALLVRVVSTKKSRIAHVILVVRGEDELALDEKLTLMAKVTGGDEGALRELLVGPLERRAPKPDVATGTSTADEPTSDATSAASGAPEVAVTGNPVGPGTEAPIDSPPREPMLIVGAMGELAARRFTYNGPTIGGLRPYNLPNVAAVGVEVELYPLRDAQSLISGLGIAGELHTSLGLRSTSVGSSEQSTGRWTRFDGVVRWWLPLTASRVTALGLSLGYGQERFSFAPPTPDLPSVAYQYARFGVDFRFRLGKGETSRGAAVFLGGSYLLVFSGGEVSEHFRRVQTWGLDVTGGLSVYLSPAIEARLAVDYRRFSAKFGGAQAGDPFVAAGALDEMVRTLAELRLKY